MIRTIMFIPDPVPEFFPSRIQGVKENEFRIRIRNIGGGSRALPVKNILWTVEDEVPGDEGGGESVGEKQEAEQRPGEQEAGEQAPGVGVQQAQHQAGQRLLPRKLPALLLPCTPQGLYS
jgi:hypothetical protein